MKSNNYIRLVAHGEAWFHDGEPILRLMKLQCSATRSAYQAVHKDKLHGNDVKKRVKKDYMSSLNQRYISDACSVAQGIVQGNAIFGGKRNWQRLVNGSMTKDEWASRRNSRLYSRGDKSKDGNPNIRIKGDRILVNDPSKRGRWIGGKVFVPNKFKPDWTCYDVRLIHESGKFRLVIGWEKQAVSPKADLSNGCVGIDANPSGLGVAEVDSKGNLLHHHFETEQRVQFASKDKRDSDVRLLAKRVVAFAKGKNKPLVIERLKFGKQKSGFKKFRRMRHNFLHGKIVESIRSRAMKEGIVVIEVNPAFTSKLGHLKFQKMFSMPIHSSAAMVIARRGMGIQERRTFVVRKADKPGKDGKIPWNLEGRNGSCVLSEKAWSWLRDCFLKPKPSSLTGTRLAVGSRPTTGRRATRLAGEPIPTTGRDGRGSTSVEERPPFKVGW
jgi:IS605 OrfB family transposase